MSKRTTYTATKKVEILAEIMEGGVKVSDASKKCDIPVLVILQWKNGQFSGGKNSICVTMNDLQGA